MKGLTEKAKDTYKADFKILLKLVGNNYLEDITPKNAEEFAKQLQSLPKNLTSSKKYKGLSLVQIHEMGITKTISDRTYNNKLGHINTLMNYAVKQDMARLKIYVKLLHCGQSYDVH